jgi:hypothetical protein
MRKMLGLICFGLGVFLFACSGGNGTSIGAPAVKPPVEAAMPAGFLVGSRQPSSRATADLVNEIQSRLFTDGPTEILGILAAIDARMATLESQALQSVRTCLSATPIDKTSDLTFPGSEPSFPQHYQCTEDNSGESGGNRLAFGKKDDVWYLREGTESGVGSIVKIDASENVEGYFVLGDNARFSGSTMLLHFKSNKAADTVEFTAGGTNIGFCQVHFKTNGSFVYVEGQRETNAGTVCESLETACLNAADNTEAASASSCSSLSGSNLELDTLGRMATGTLVASAANNVDLNGLKAIAVPDFTGIGDFNAGEQ